MTRFAPAALAIAALFASAPALAAEDATKPTKLVFHGDLDLSQPADRARLERRIVGATRAVCIIEDRMELARCRAKARTDAQAQVQRAIARASSAERLATATAGAPIVGN